MVKAKEVQDKPISILIDDSDFRKVKEGKISIMDKKVAYPAYNVILNENILYLEKQNIVLAIMNNIMAEEENKKEFRLPDGKAGRERVAQTKRRATGRPYGNFA